MNPDIQSLSKAACQLYKKDSSVKDFHKSFNTGYFLIQSSKRF